MLDKYHINNAYIRELTLTPIPEIEGLQVAEGSPQLNKPVRDTRDKF